MPRPCCRRWVRTEPPVGLFKPAGVPAARLSEVTLTLDECEALRLADRDGLYHEQAAERMGISRATFGRIVESARRKVAEALFAGQALRIAGGSVTFVNEAAPGPARGRGPCAAVCRACGTRLARQPGMRCRDLACPQCGGRMRRADEPPPKQEGESCRE